MKLDVNELVPWAELASAIAIVLSLVFVASSAALSTMQFAPQLGQKPCRLHKNATSLS